MSGSIEIVGKRRKRVSVSLELTAVLPSWGTLSKGRVTFYVPITVYRLLGKGSRNG
jgi:hypothetical protein